MFAKLTLVRVVRPDLLPGWCVSRRHPSRFAADTPF
jgi:hypothetical protein